MRGLIFDEIVAPRMPSAPKEPIPCFARMIHDGYKWCGWDRGMWTEGNRGHLYSCIPSKVRRVEIWKNNQLYGDRSVPLDWVENGTPCPHCAAEEHSKAVKQFKAEEAGHEKQIALHKRYTSETARPRRKRGLKV